MANSVGRQRINRALFRMSSGPISGQLIAICVLAKISDNVPMFQEFLAELVNAAQKAKALRIEPERPETTGELFIVVYFESLHNTFGNSYNQILAMRGLDKLIEAANRVRKDLELPE